MNNATIAAISTAAGSAAIAVVRISGEYSLEVASRIFFPKNSQKSISTAKGYTAMLGMVKKNDTLIDEAVAVIYKAPYSFTGENVVEICCHGGNVASRETLKAAFWAGAEPAAAGEFTRRAFLNGKISLEKVEGISSMLNAQTDKAALLAADALGGSLGEELSRVKEKMVATLSHIAAYVDFPEEDVDELSVKNLSLLLDEIECLLRVLLQNYEHSKIYKNGIETAIVGLPNVGKSSLLNLLSGTQTAIVTPIAGTTRDVVELQISVNGLLLNIADTAGIHETDNIIEQEGIKRSYLRLQRAELVLAVFDGSKETTKEDIVLSQTLKDKKSLAIINKNDLPQKFNASKISGNFSQTIFCSATSHIFKGDIITAIESVLSVKDIQISGGCLVSERQKNKINTALSLVEEAKAALESLSTLDAASVSLEEAITVICEIFGENATETVLNEVFSSFCVGK